MRNILFQTLNICFQYVFLNLLDKHIIKSTHHYIDEVLLSTLTFMSTIYFKFI